MTSSALAVPTRLPHRLGRRSAVIAVGVALVAAAGAVAMPATYVVAVPLGVFGVVAAGQLILAVLAMRWLFDARTNLDRLPGAAPRWHPAWSTCAWLIPVAGIFIGTAVLADVAANSVPAEDPAGRRRMVRWAWWWCACFTGSFVAGGGVGAMEMAGAPTATLVGLDILIQGISLAAAALFIGLLRTVARLHDRHGRSPAAA